MTINEEDIKEQFVYEDDNENKGPCTQQEMSKHGKELNQFKDMSFEEKEKKSLEIIEEALDKDIENPVISSSFGKDSTVLMHLVHRVDDSVPVVMNDTGLMFPETKEHKRKLEKKWNLDVDVVKPDMTYWDVADKYGFPKPQGRNTIQGDNTEPKCCKILKTDPMRDYIKENDIDLDFVGVLGDEGRQRRLMYVMRGTFNYFHKTWGIWKSVPMLFWHEDDVWEYLDKYDLPVNPAYEKYNQKRTGCVACFDADTVIYGMNNNRKISELVMDDKVLTSEGYQTPKTLLKRKYTGEMINLNIQGLKPIKCTADHSILTADINKNTYYERTNKLRDDSEYERHKYDYKSEWNVNSIEWKDARNITDDDYTVVKRKQKFSDNKINKDLSWLAGLYVAEGFVSKDRRRARFTLGSHEKVVIENCMEKMLNEFDTGTKINPKNKKSVTLIDGYKDAPTYFELFGRIGEEKKVPYFMKNSKPETQRNFIKGWIDGDGHISDYKKTITISTSTKKLKDDLVEMLTTTFGILPGVYKAKQNDTINGEKYDVKPTYRITWRISEWENNESKLTKYYSDEDFLYIPVKSVETEHVEDYPVYNMQTKAGDYSVPFTVKNCTAHPRWKKAIAKYSPDLLKLIMKRMDNQTSLDDFM